MGLGNGYVARLFVQEKQPRGSSKIDGFCRAKVACDADGKPEVLPLRDFRDGAEAVASPNASMDMEILPDLTDGNARRRPFRRKRMRDRGTRHLHPRLSGERLFGLLFRM
jgi:hypothetical protein